MKFIRSTWLLAAAVIVAPAVQAQVEEITVSAQRRAQDLQDVPIAVSAFSMEDQARLQLDQTIDLGAAVPSLQTYAVTANQSTIQLFMRGAGVQNPGFIASESPVGIYLDNVYNGRLASANLDLADIERIEVLRGPQGTLYGRNTIAGAIKVVTREPTEDFYADASIAYGNYETSKVKASVGGEVLNGLGLSISGLYHDRGEGWITRGSEGGKPLGEYTNKGLRAKANWFGGEMFSAKLSLGYVDNENDGYNGIPYGPSTAPASIPGEPVEGFYDTLVPDESAGLGKTKQSDIMLELAWDFGGATLKSITGFIDTDDTFRFDLNGGVPPGFPTNGGNGGAQGVLINSNSNNETFTQEFLLQGLAFDERLNWTAGLFFLNEEGKQNYNPSIPLASADINEASKTDTQSLALYVDGTWNFNERWSVALGARYTKEDKKFTNECTVNDFDFSLTCYDENFDPNEWTLNQKVDYSEFDPRLLVQYSPTDELTWYASLSQGFQAGGFQTLCLGIYPCADNIYKPQKVNSAELGLKSQFIENTVRVNVAAFYADYKDMQQTSIAQQTLVFPTLNVGSAEVYGLELEANWVPIPSVNAFLIGSWMSESISEGAQENLPDTNQGRLAGLPSNTLRVGADWTPGIGSSWQMVLGADVNYVSSYYATINNVLEVPSYTRMNGRFGFRQPDGGWDITLRAKNLTDSNDIVSGIAGNGTNIRTPLAPREYMLSVGYRW